ncbi:alpha/beta fold hydrolase [Streptomyces sp. NPDC050560]|uniref:alpha/beta fold hydrolase n=1 Tax=Streptomyces sp. NPDC050560 TaxID=3365630 RepID=UPI0037A57323
MITAEYTLPGAHVREHRVAVPLDWAAEGGPALSVFAREVVDPARRNAELPLLLYLQGGPGGKASRPMGVHDGGWLPEALRHYRVVLLDQRGTGRSSPVDGPVVEAFGSAREAAAYLGMFRADSIVADAEHLRVAEFGGGRWTTLGQSYGGFLTMTYLSRAPGGLAACLVAGGLPAVIRPDATELYRRTYPRVAAKNRVYRERYPGDVEVVARVADLVAGGGVRLPDGDALTVRRLQTLGLDFGMAPGFERMHWLFDEAFADGGAGAGERLTETFLGRVMERTGFADRPLFAALQESIFAVGDGVAAWAAERERAAHPAFRPEARPLLFTGEMIYPWMFEELRGLRPFRAAVEELATRPSWPPLYDTARLAANEVPVAAVVYADDMYVDADLSLETASAVGRVRTWVTNEYEHDGLASDGRVFGRLRGMLAERGELPVGA